jgi:hypothetical protein
LLTAAIRYPKVLLAVMVPELVGDIYEAKVVTSGVAPPEKYTPRLPCILPYDHNNVVFALTAVLSVNFHGVPQKFKVQVTEGAHATVTAQEPLPNVTPFAVTAMKPPTEIVTFGLTVSENAPQHAVDARVSPMYNALGARLEGGDIMGKLADAVAPRMSPALFKTAAPNVVPAAHGIAGFVTDSNEKEITEPEAKFPDEKTALKMPLNMVAVPAAAETGKENFNGLETGHRAYPVRVTITIEFDGMLAVTVKVIEYLTPEAPAAEVLTETAGVELNRLKMAGNRPTEVVVRIVPALDVMQAATLVAAACAKYGLRTLPNENITSLLALNSPDVRVIVNKNTLLGLLGYIVAVPDAPPEGDTNLSKLAGEQAGAAAFTTVEEKELPVNVTVNLALDGMLKAGVNATVMTTPEAPAITLDSEIAIDAAPKDPFRIEGNVPDTDDPRTTPVLLVMEAATFDFASCGRAGSETGSNENEIGALAANTPAKKVA